MAIVAALCQTFFLSTDEQRDIGFAICRAHKLIMIECTHEDGVRRSGRGLVNYPRTCSLGRMMMRKMCRVRSESDTAMQLIAWSKKKYRRKRRQKPWRMALSQRCAASRDSVPPPGSRHHYRRRGLHSFPIAPWRAPPRPITPSRNHGVSPEKNNSAARKSLRRERIELPMYTTECIVIFMITMGIVRVSMYSYLQQPASKMDFLFKFARHRARARFGRPAGNTYHLYCHTIYRTPHTQD